MKKINIKKEDKVLVLSGKDAGKKGKVLRIIGKKGKVVVEGVNMIKKHQRPTQKFQGGIVERPNAIYISKVMLICPRCNVPARVGRKMQNEKNLRCCKKCGEIIDKS